MNALRVGVAVLAGVGAIAASGCSSFGGAFGMNAQAFKLSDDAKAVRAAYPAAMPIPKETQKTLHPAFVVEPGDTLLVQPADLDSPVRLPGDQQVIQDGTIDLGRFGRPVVAGKTLPQIEADVSGIIQAHLKTEADKAKAMREAKDKDAKEREAVKDVPTGPVVVTVRLVGRASKVYYVIGEVNAAGVFPITGRETVLDGVFAAGNLTRNASTRNIILSRPTSPDGCRIVLPICWDDITQLADPSTNYQLMPGDRIYVASKAPLEDFRARKKGECPPCDKPQVACGPGGCAPTGTPPATPVVEMAPPPALPVVVVK